MAISKHPAFGPAMLAALVAIVAAVFLLSDRGYGKVSPQTYQFSKAIYSACQTRNEKHLDRAEALLLNSDDDPLPSNERDWLEAIIAKARGGDWESAAKNARRMMEDQVRY